MGMLIKGIWSQDIDQTMKAGRYHRQTSSLPQLLASNEVVGSSLIFIASQSCPWSHAATIVHALNGLEELIPIQFAVGPRTEGYRLAQDGPLSAEGEYIHQLYSKTNQTYTGRATVPFIWDKTTGKIISNDSTMILKFFDSIGSQTNLNPCEYEAEIATFLPQIYNGLANAVYRAGKAQRQDEYEQAVEAVYTTLHRLENHLESREYLITTHLTEPDIRLFATLVRFDTVYATHFRCTRYRLADFLNLWQFTRNIYQMPDVQKTVNLKEIRSSYYLNDGDHNPHNIIAEQPILNW